MLFNFVDIIIVGVLLISVFIGIYRGFVKETITLVTWILAGILAWKCGMAVGNLFSGITTQIVRHVIGGIIVFISVLIFGGIINFILSKVVKVTGFGTFDKVLGCGLGTLRGVVIVLLLVPVFAGSLAEETCWKQSTLIPKCQATNEYIAQHVPEEWVKDLSDLADSLTL